MWCTYCGAQNNDQAAFCQSCGKPTSRPENTVLPSQIQLDLKRLGTGDLVVLGSTILLFISLFLPWYSYFFGSLSAMSAGGFRILILILSLAIIGYLFSRTMFDKMSLPILHWQLLLIATGVNFLLTLLAFFVKPISILQWDIGAYLAIICAIGAVVGAFVTRSPALISTLFNLDQTKTVTTQPSVMQAEYSNNPPPPTNYQQTPIPVDSNQVLKCKNCFNEIPYGNQVCGVCGTQVT